MEQLLSPVVDPVLLQAVPAGEVGLAGLLVGDPCWPPRVSSYELIEPRPGLVEDGHAVPGELRDHRQRGADIRRGIERNSVTDAPGQGQLLPPSVAGEREDGYGTALHRWEPPFRFLQAGKVGPKRFPCRVVEVARLENGAAFLNLT